MKIIILSLSVSLIILTGCNLDDFFIKKYFNDNYQPGDILINGKNEYPDKYSIPGVPCISYENAYCASAALQMVLAQNNLNISIDSLNWMMGFTYSFYYGGTINNVLPYSDPEVGYVKASASLGIKREYLVTSDSLTYISNIKHLLSLNKPLRIALNSSIINNQKGFYPHSILLIGYTKDSVYYYDTGGKNRYLINYQGERIDWNRFIQSVKSISTNFRYPWSYNLMSFDITSQIKSIDSDEIWLNISKSLIGDAYGPTGTGTKGIQKLIKDIKNNDLSTSNWDRFVSIIKMGIYTRRDNSNFIKRNFENDKFWNISELIFQSGELYKEALIAAQNKDKIILIETLNKISEIESNVGKLIIKK